MPVSLVLGAYYYSKTLYTKKINEESFLIFRSGTVDCVCFQNEWFVSHVMTFQKQKLRHYYW